MTERTERVTLTLVDRFSSKMARVATATEAASRALHDFDRSSTSASRSQEGLTRSTTRTTTTLRRTTTDIDRTSSAFRRGAGSIDSYSGRLGLLTTAAASLGPALIPITAAALPAVSGLAAGLGATAGAAGVAVLAFHGVSDALKALDDYQLEPTEANLKKLHQTMGQLPESSQKFVRTLDDLEGPLNTTLRTVAANGLFPGLEDGINELMGGLPAVKDLVGDLATEMGRLASDAGDALAHDDDWQRFFSYVKSAAVPTLDAFARAAGNVAAGLADLLTDFAPLSSSFNDDLLSMSRNFREWADNLGNTRGFREFVDYIRQSGPQVSAFLSAIGGALVALTQAAAPWGRVVLPALTAAADVFTKVASSPIGPTLFSAAAGALALSRAVSILKAANPVLLGLTAVAGGVALLSRGFDDAQRNAGAMSRQLEHTAWAQKQKEALATVRGSLDQVTGAYTKATRAAVLQELSNNGLISAGRKLGISAGTLIDATLGEADARKKVADATSDENTRKLRNTTLTKDNFKAVTGQLHAIDKLRTSMGDVTRQTARQRKAVQDQAIATDGLNKVLGITKKHLDSWPKKLVTQLNVNGIPQGMAGIAKLGDKVKDLTRPQWKVLLAAAGVDPTTANIKRAQDAADKFARTHATATVSVRDEASATLGSIYAGLGRINGYHASAYITTTHLDKFEQATRQRAGGGIVYGPGTSTSDSIPARLSDGEYVVKAAAVEKYGVGFLDRVNTMAFANGGLVQRFASGGRVTPAERRDNRLNDAIDRLTKSIDKTQKSVDKARSQVQKWTDKQDQLASTIRSSLTLDAFGSSTSWNDTNQAGSLGSWRATERTQRTNAQALAKDIAKLRRDGASDEFISYILSQQDPVSVAHMFASETKAQVRSDQSLYASATRAVNVTANAGGAIYNNEIATSNRHLAQTVTQLKEQNHHLKELRAEERKAHEKAQEQRRKQPHEIGKAINGAAAKGHRDAR